MSTNNYDLLQTDREKIRKLWGKTNADVQDYIRILKEWHKTQNHLPEMPDDNTIEFVLTNCKYRVEKAKKTIDSYYTLRTIIPEYFKGHRPTMDVLERISKMWYFTPLPKLTPEMYRIIFLKYAKEQGITFDLDETTAYEVNVSEIRMHEDLSMGDVYIIDCADLSLSQATKYTPTSIRKYFTIFEKVYSSRGKYFHIINYPPFALQVLNMAKMIIKKKIFDRVKLHSSMESLYEYVPKELLPAEYGGKEKSLDELQELWFQKLREYEKRFDELEEMTVDESLRPEPLVANTFVMSTDNLLQTDREKIRKLWGKSNSDTEEYIRILKEWLKTQKHLPEIPTDNQLEFVLTNCKYSIEKAKTAIDNYYTVRSILPDFFKGHHPVKTDALNRVSKMWNYVPLPKLTTDMQRLFIMKYLKEEDIPYSVQEATAYEINIFEIRMHEDLAMGNIYIVDAADVSLSHVAKLTPTTIKNYLVILEQFYKSRVTNFHVINHPPVMKSILNTVKMMAKKKIYDRLILHSSLESLYEYVPRELLPIEYGGEENSVEVLQEFWFQKLRDYEKRFDELEEMTVDESLRPEPLVNSDILGYYGNFKKIEVD
ncbi:unnamed protein product [Phyllotreta striolata]|uniref:CRAL-TRIO domain-containing protein n=1 Tax=Phyllotreta striolata TaxID=444603 RepID=A0A9N9XRI8_PHYSR|nr:unnamed protein product [Phyllotreta striolata]